MKRPKVGSKMRTWFSGREDGMSTVLGVMEYKGPQFATISA